MKMLNKYIALWTVVWLQFYFFFDEMQSLALNTQSLPKQIVLIVMALYCLHFIIYFFMLINRRLSVQVQKNNETFFCVFGLVLTGAMLVYILSNEWLWTQANTGQIILEVGKFVMMVISMLVANFFHFIKKETVDMDDRTLWGTYDTYDLAFWGALVVSGFLLSLYTSKIPNMNRNYYEFLRFVLVYGIILAALNKNRLFISQRKLFYSVLIGYFVACTFQSLIVIFIFNPSLGDTLTNFGIKTNYIVISGILTVIHWLVLAGWVVWDMLQEDARTKLQR